jgi:hypothetical protein
MKSLKVSDSSAYNLLSLKHSAASCYSVYNLFPLLYIRMSAIIFSLSVVVCSLYNNKVYNSKIKDANSTQIRYYYNDSNILLYSYRGSCSIRPETSS